MVFAGDTQDCIRRGLDQLAVEDVAADQAGNQRLNIYQAQIFCVAVMQAVLVSARVILIDVCISIFLFGICDADEGSSALFAMDHTGQHVFVLAAVIGFVVLVIFHALRHPFPCFLINDARYNILFYNRVFRQLAASPLPHVPHFAFEPSIRAGIAFISQDRMQAVAANFLPELADNAHCVNLCDNIAVCAAARVHCEDCADRLRLALVYHVFAVYNVIAKRWPASTEEALPCANFHAVHGLLTGLQHLMLAYADGDQLRQKGAGVGDIAELFRGGKDLDAKHLHFFAKRKPVYDIAAAARQIVHNHSIKLLCLSGANQVRKPLAHAIGTGLRLIDKGRHQVQVVFEAVIHDAFQLSLDRPTVALIVCRVPGVSGGS